MSQPFGGWVVPRPVERVGFEGGYFLEPVRSRVQRWWSDSANCCVSSRIVIHTDRIPERQQPRPCVQQVSGPNGVILVYVDYGAFNC